MLKYLFIFSFSTLLAVSPNANIEAKSNRKYERLKKKLNIYFKSGKAIKRSTINSVNQFLILNPNITWSKYKDLSNERCNVAADILYSEVSAPVSKVLKCIVHGPNLGEGSCDDPTKLNFFVVGMAMVDETKKITYYFDPYYNTSKSLTAKEWIQKGMCAQVRNFNYLIVSHIGEESFPFSRYHISTDYDGFLFTASYDPEFLLPYISVMSLSFNYRL